MCENIACKVEQNAFAMIAKTFYIYLTWVVTPPTTPYVYNEFAFSIVNTIYEWLWRKVNNLVLKFVFSQ